MENKAAILTELKKIELKTIPMPELKNGEVLIKLEAVGICGSDVHYYQHGKIGDFIVDFPFILGHECSGIIEQVAPDVTSLKIGDRVVMEPGIPCGECEFCLNGHYNLCPDVKFLATPPYDGCLMNYIAYPANWVFPLPSNVSTLEGALVEPAAIGINACLTGGVKLGDTVVIYGAGCIGLVTLLAAKAYGAAKIIVVDLLEKRLETAASYGAVTINTGKCDATKEILALTGGRGADVVIDCAGVNETIKSTVHVAKAAGVIVLVGLGTDRVDGLNTSPLSTKELTITSIFRYKNLYPTTISAISSGKIDVAGIISNKFSFEDCAKAYAVTMENAADIVKSVIIFD